MNNSKPLDAEPITVEGHALMKDELRRLKSVDRPRVIQEIATAREHGDLSENAEYHAAREKQSFLEGRIGDLESRLARAQVVDVSKITHRDRVAFGATVTLYNTETNEETAYQIVSEYEADPKLSRISFTSPIARACIGKRLDDTVRVQIPGGTRELEITDIQYK